MAPGLHLCSFCTIKDAAPGLHLCNLDTSCKGASPAPHKILYRNDFKIWFWGAPKPLKSTIVKWSVLH